MEFLSLDLEKKKYFRSVDFFKFICAIMVVWIHSYAFNSYPKLTEFGSYITASICRIAVPFFFVTSGYLCFRKTSTTNFDISKSLSYAKKIFFLLVIWEILYIPNMLFTYLIGGDTLENTLKGYFLYGINQFWYLYALFISILVLTFLLYKRIPITLIFSLSLIFYSRTFSRFLL